MKRYLIIGNGIAGTTAAEQIRKRDAEGEIILLTKESLPLYSRIRLPDFICDKIFEDDLVIKNQEWHDKHNIKLIRGIEIERIDFQGKKAFVKNGDHIKKSYNEDMSQPIDMFDFDSLLLAVGSKSFIPPIKGTDQGGVVSLRTVDDAKIIIKEIRIERGNTKEVVAIGGGLLGLEAAAAMIHAGVKVTVVESCDRLLPRQLDYQGAKLLQLFLEKMGFVFRLGESTEEIIGEISENAQKLASILKGLKLKPQVTGVKLKSGDIIKADTLLFSAGVRPDLSLILNSGIKTDKGILVNERMETSIPSIYAAGDVAEYQGINFCIWTEAMEQGRVAGINMSGGNETYKNIPQSNILKIAGISLASAGEIDVEDKMDADIFSTESVYKKIVKDNSGNIVGCIMIGDTTDFNKIVQKIKGE